MGFSKGKISIFILIFINFVLGGFLYFKLTAPQTTSPEFLNKIPKTLSLEQQLQIGKEQLKKQLSQDFAIIAKSPFLVAGNISPVKLRKIFTDSILKPAQVMWKNYFKRKPNQIIRILLFNGQKSYRYWALKLFGDKKVSYFGYYLPSSQTMLMDINTGTGTLIHELTHALLNFDCPHCPTWMNEGLASMHEGCQVYDHKIVGGLNWRYPILLKALQGKKLRSLKSLFLARDFYQKMVDRNYAQARYFMVYLQRKGQLTGLYKAIRDNYLKGSPAVEDYKIIEKLRGEKIIAVEKDFNNWILKIKPKAKKPF